MVQQLAVAMCRSAKKPSLNEWVDKVDMVFSILWELEVRFEVPVNRRMLASINLKG